MLRCSQQKFRYVETLKGSHGQSTAIVKGMQFQSAWAPVGLKESQEGGTNRCCWCLPEGTKRHVSIRQVCVVAIAFRR